MPMRDSVVLRADVIRPAEHKTFPVLVYRTPYGKDSAQQEYTTIKHAAERGYAVVIQDVYLRKLYSKLFTQPPKQKIGSEEYRDEKGARPRISRRYASLASSAGRYPGCEVNGGTDPALIISAVF